MKLICRQCGKTNRYTVGEVIGSKGFSCEYCGFYEPNRAGIAGGIAAGFGSVAMFFGGKYIMEYVLYEVSSEWVRTVSSIFIVFGVFFVLTPLIALVICLVRNCITRRRRKKVV